MVDISGPILTTFIVYLVVMIAVGLWVYNRTKNLSDFALGGRELNAPTAALSAQASDMSGWLLIGLPGAVYAAGIGASWIAFGLAVGTYINWKVIAPRLRSYTERANDAISLSAYFEERFEDASRMLRLLSAIVIVVFFTVYVASALVAGGLLFEEVFGVDFFIAVTLTTVVIVSYAFLGGFLAVSLTDVLQGSMMWLALIGLPLVAIGTLGGFDELTSALRTASPGLLELGSEATFIEGSWVSGETLGVVAVISLLSWGLGYFGQPHILARFMGISSVKAIPFARRIGVGWVVTGLFGAVMVGLAGIALLEPLDNPETVFIELIQQLLNPWVGGILLAAVLAAVMSTADSQLIVSSTALTEDFYRAFVNEDAEDMTLVWVGRATVIGVAIVGYVLALQGGAVLDIVAYAWAGFGAAFGPVVILSLFWSKMTRAGAFAGIIGGAATVLLWERIDGMLGTGLYEMVPGVLVATLLALVFGRLGAPPTREWVGDYADDLQALEPLG